VVFDCGGVLVIDDPTSIVLYLVTALAGGMYPLGFMFGVCSDCCNKCRSDSCEGFDLEEAFSCRSDGYPICFRSQDLLSLQFTSPCFGSGAAGTVLGRGADVGAGPLISVTLSEGGSGYAVLGRRAPTITLANTGSAPATMTVSTESVQDNCQVHTWRISSVTVTNGGRGYAGWGSSFAPATATATWAVEAGGVVVGAATGTISTKQTQPTITASVSGPGTGATFTVALQLFGDPTRNGGWQISGVSVSGNTSGYINGSAIVFDIGAATRFPFSAPASAYINTDANGAITSVTVQNGSFYAIVGVIDTITFASNSERGSYYYPDSSLPAYVRPPTVTVVRTAPSGGSGAQITATVDGNTASATFGKVTALTLTNAGSDYLAWYKDAIEYLGDGKFALGNAVQNPQPGYQNHPDLIYSGVHPPTKGCWVSGPGIAEGTKVTEMSAEIVDYGEPSPPKGCCDISYDTTATGGFGFCGSVQQRTEKVIRTEQECNDREAAIAAEQCFSGGFGGGSMVNSTSNLSKAWTECTNCNGDPIGSREMIIHRTYSGRRIFTVSPPPESTPTGCIRVCGGSGLGHPFPRNLSLSEDYFRHNSAEGGPYDYTMRRMCVRWVCRCYDGTGKRSQTDPETGEPLYPNPYDWYTVGSTKEVGGPVVFGGSLTSKLEAATTGDQKLEHDILFGYEAWPAEEGTRFCTVWRFVFYGTSQKSIQDRCNFPNDEAPPGTVTPKDAYSINYIDRCSCQ